MLGLTIITIAYNNLGGLRKTAKSVLSPKFRDFEWIIVDGASNDGTQDYLLEIRKQWQGKPEYLQIISEPDKGIYNAMNKGICLAHGEYCLFLNSEDYLYAADVLNKIYPPRPVFDIFYGNYYTSDGVLHYGTDMEEVTTLYFVDYTIHHTGCAFIRRALFDKYGFYDEELKIVSDWKWFAQVVGFNNVSLGHIDVVLSVYDNTGVSSIQIEQRTMERNKVKEELFPKRLIRDYERYYELVDEKLKSERQIRESYSYRLGAFLLKPFRLFYVHKKSI